MDRPISRGATVIKLVGFVLILIGLHASGERLGFPVFRIDGIEIAGVSALGLSLPWGAIHIWLLFAFVLNLLHLAYRRWTEGTRWFELGLSLLALAIWWAIFGDAREIFTDGVPLPDVDDAARRFAADVIVTGLAIAVGVSLLALLTKVHRLWKYYGIGRDAFSWRPKPRTEFERTLRRDWADVYRFYLDDETRSRLPDMNVIERGAIVVFELVKAMVSKLTVARRVLFIGAAVTFVQGLPAAKWIGLSLFLWILLLELKDKLLAHDELALGRAVQSALLPTQAPEISGWDIWLFNRPAREVSGDLVDYMTLGADRWAISLGDVSGKGLGAALLSAQLQATLRALAPRAGSLEELGNQTNAIVYRDSPRNRFASLIYAELRENSGELRVLNAGHPPCVVVRDTGLDTMPLGKPALGLVPDLTYREDQTVLAPGDLVIAYSDGLTDAMNDASELFGEARLMALMPRLRDLTAARAGAELLGAVETFVDGESQHDDLSLAILKRR